MKWFHKSLEAERRGGNLPARFWHSAKKGVTLVELLISVLILTIVCVSWLQIIGTQSARKEARRRESVDRLAGMMDAFLYEKKDVNISSETSYEVFLSDNKTSFNCFERNNDYIYPLFDERTKDGFRVSNIGYQLRVVSTEDMINDGWEFNDEWGESKWLVGKLYNRSECKREEAGEPFFTLPVCLGL